jgi:hypothetical protein
MPDTEKRRMRMAMKLRCMTLMLFLVALTVSICTSSSLAGDIFGDWRIHWPNGTVNAITLQGQGEIVTGVYTDDSGKSCQVTGKSAAESLSFTVQCKTWKAVCTGRMTPVGAIEGPFQTDVGVSGTFSMKRGGGLPTRVF